MKNKALKIAIIAAETTQKELAKEMGINAKTFMRKVNGNMVNNYIVHFTEREREWLAERLGIATNEIE